MTSLGPPTTSMQAAASRHALGDLIWSPSRGARLARRAAIVVMFLLGLAELQAPLASLLMPAVYMKDFVQEYLLARAVVGGTNPYLPVPVLAERFLGAVPIPHFPHPTPHPPTVGLLDFPLAFLDYQAAAIVWLLLEMGCLVASVHLLGRVVGLRLRALWTLVIAMIALVWSPFPLELMLGQLMLPILLLLATAVYAIQIGRRTLGGALVGASVLLKPVAWPVILVFVVRGDRRALGGALATVLGGYAASALVLGMATVFDYLTRVLPLVARLYRASDGNISLWTVGWRLFAGTYSELPAGGSAPHLIESTQAAEAVSVALPAIVLLVSLIAVRRQRSEVRSLGLMICVSILVSPVSWINYPLLAAVPALEVGRWLIRHHLPPRETNAALLVAALMVPVSGWVTLSLAVGGSSSVPGGTALIQLASSLLRLGPAFAIAALAVLLVMLPDVPGESLRRERAVEENDGARL